LKADELRALLSKIQEKASHLGMTFLSNVFKGCYIFTFLVVL